MDMSKLKWPLIILVVVVAGWILSNPGVNYFHKKFTGPVPEDPAVAARYEAGLTKLGGYMMTTFRYGKAERIFEDDLRLYPQGKNATYNYYRLAKVKEHLGKYQEATDILANLMAQNASTIDRRIPVNEQLDLRRNKLLETHELGEISAGGV